MSTHTLPSFSAACSDCPWEPAYFIRFPHEGEVYAVGFDSIFELTQTLVGECVDGRLVEQIIDFAEESMEWHESPHVAEAVCDPDYDPRSVAFRRPEPSPFWDWFASTLRLGAVAAPWVILLILGRVAWAKAVAWGWV